VISTYQTFCEFGLCETEHSENCAVTMNDGVRPRHLELCVFDHKRVVVAGDEFDEELVVVQ
jgi:hypothetical protein